MADQSALLIKMSAMENVMPFIGEFIISLPTMLDIINENVMYSSFQDNYNQCSCFDESHLVKIKN